MHIIAIATSFLMTFLAGCYFGFVNGSGKSAMRGYRPKSRLPILHWVTTPVVDLDEREAVVGMVAAMLSYILVLAWAVTAVEICARFSGLPGPWGVLVYVPFIIGLFVGSSLWKQVPKRPPTPERLELIASGKSPGSRIAQVMAVGIFTLIMFLAFAAELKPF